MNFINIINFTNILLTRNDWQDVCKKVTFIKCLCAVLKLLSHVRLFVTPWTVALQASLSMGILQARILEWVAMPSSRGSSQPRDRTHISHIAGRALPSEPPGKPKCLSLLYFNLGMFWQFVLSRHSRVQLFAMPCTVDFQAPLSIGFSRQEYWSGLPCLPLEDLPDPRIKTTSLIFPALTDRFFTTRATKFSRSCNASKNLSQITVCNSENA